MHTLGERPLTPALTRVFRRMWLCPQHADSGRRLSARLGTRERAGGHVGGARHFHGGERQAGQAPTGRSRDTGRRGKEDGQHNGGAETRREGSPGPRGGPRLQCRPQSGVGIGGPGVGIGPGSGAGTGSGGAGAGPGSGVGPGGCWTGTLASLSRCCGQANQSMPRRSQLASPDHEQTRTVGSGADLSPTVGYRGVP